MIKIGKAAIVGIAMTAAISAYAGNITTSDPNWMDYDSNPTEAILPVNPTNAQKTTWANNWYKGLNGKFGEFREVEPGMSTGEKWDIAAMYFDLEEKQLGVLGGFNFKDGVVDASYSSGNPDGVIRVGDIFIKKNTAPVNSSDPSGYNQTTTNTFGYDYALRLNFSSNTYTVIDLNAQSSLLNAVYYNYPNSNPGTNNLNAASNPWKFNGDPVSGSQTYSMSFGTVTASTADGLAEYRDQSNAVLFPDITFTKYGSAPIYNMVLNDIDKWAPSKTSLYFHLTMECGNDNATAELAGGFKVPDHSHSVILIGLALISLAVVQRRKN